MPDELQFETENGQPLNQLVYKRVIRGLPSPPTTFYVKNLSETKSYVGSLHVLPTEGRSYSEDLYLGDDYEDWGRSLELDLSPGQRIRARSRVVPKATPTGSLGRASISSRGEWITR